LDKRKTSRKILKPFAAAAGHRYPFQLNRKKEALSKDLSHELSMTRFFVIPNEVKKPGI
jgi:hypothetical protein